MFFAGLKNLIRLAKILKGSEGVKVDRNLQDFASDLVTKLKDLKVIKSARDDMALAFLDQVEGRIGGSESQNVGEYQFTSLGDLKGSEIASQDPFTAVRNAFESISSYAEMHQWELDTMAIAAVRVPIYRDQDWHRPNPEDEKETSIVTVRHKIHHWGPGDSYAVYEEIKALRTDPASEPVPMMSAYSPEGYYIGNESTAAYLCVDLGLSVYPAAPDHQVCSIGFSASENKWYGWSHRAIFGFGIGDRLFEERYGDDHTNFARHGSRLITNLDEAKQAAINFASSVS